MTKLASFNLRFRVVLWAALLAGIALMSFGVRQVDLWWQLPEGLKLLETHRLPHEAVNAFGLASQPFIDEYTLHELVLAVLYRLGGLGAIHAAFIATWLLVFALPLAPALRRPRDLVSCALVAVAAIFMINRFEQRPEIVGVLLFAVLVSLLLRTQKFSAAFLLRLALLMAVWTGVHSSYLIGLAALGLWLAQRTLHSSDAPWRMTQAALTFGTACVAVLINPYGWHRVAFTFAQQRDLGSNLLSREMWPAWDQPFDVQGIMILAAALVVLALVSRQRPPAWLGALAVLVLLLAAFNIRHMSFLAVMLLFLAANRREADPGVRWQPVLAPLLVAGCIAAFLFDFVAARSAISDLGETKARHDRMLVPSLVQAARDEKCGAVLCHDAEGSYLSFTAPEVHPLLDSGQGHFDDATKRFYFFTVQDPFAFDRALLKLPAVNGVLVTPPVGGWTLAMIRRPGWYLAACDEHGLLFLRLKDDPYHYATPGPLQALYLDRYRDRAIAEGDFVRAFYFSALTNTSGQSLEVLDRSTRTSWSEAFFSFTRGWIRSLSPGEIQSFIALHGMPKNPLLRELFLAQMSDETPLPEVGASGMERLARVLTLLGRGDEDAARTLFTRISQPKVSPLYYSLRAHLLPEWAKGESAAERWQDWTAGGETMFENHARVLNARASPMGKVSNVRL